MENKDIWGREDAPRCDNDCVEFCWIVSSCIDYVVAIKSSCRDTVMLNWVEIEKVAALRSKVLRYNVKDLLTELIKEGQVQILKCNLCGQNQQELIEVPYIWNKSLNYVPTYILQLMPIDHALLRRIFMHLYCCEYLYLLASVMTWHDMSLGQLLAPQSGALRISAYRDFQSNPIQSNPSTYSFRAFKPFYDDLKQPK